MKLAIVCPANINYMPYLKIYTNLLNDMNVEYDIINWDRLGIEEKSEFTYNDEKSTLQKDFFSYLRYKKFVLEKLKKNNYSHLIIFSLQLTFFLRKFLAKYYVGKYIVDIRDYNKIIKLFNVKKVVKDSFHTFISSNGFLEWLPILDEKISVSHNINIERIKQYGVEFNNTKELRNKKELTISYIGTIRDTALNIELISLLRNSKNIKLTFDGKIQEEKKFKDFIKENNINNIDLSGEYNYEEENNLYRQTDIINILIPNDSLNSTTLLPNRLYNAVLYAKPIITFENTYVGEIVKKYKLGLTISELNELENKLRHYIYGFEKKEYDINRMIFFEKIGEDYNAFTEIINSFISY